MTKAPRPAGPGRPGTAGPTVPVGAATPAAPREWASLHDPARAEAASRDGTNLAESHATMALPQLADTPAAARPPVPALALVAPRTTRVSRAGTRPTRGADAARRAADEWTASVSHDLQAPLRQIAGFTRLLAREAAPVLTDTTRQYLDDIAGATAHMTALVEALLALSRAGAAALDDGDVDLDAVVRAAVRDAARDASDRTIHWHIGPLPAVRGDATLLRQVFANLVGNAVKYTRPRPSAHIEIAAATSAGEVVVSVRDNGVGFDMRHADRLFGVFERLHAGAEFEGAGVGLAIVRRIVERHGGRVWATAAPGGGAAFHVALPVGLAAAGPGDTAARAGATA